MNVITRQATHSIYMIDVKGVGDKSSTVGKGIRSRRRYRYIAVQRRSSPQNAPASRRESPYGVELTSRWTICLSPIYLTRQSCHRQSLFSGQSQASVPNTPRCGIRLNYLIATRACFELRVNLLTDRPTLATDLDLEPPEKPVHR